MHGGLITDLAVVTVVAAITGMLARRLGQPSILGYLLAGLIVGPYIPIPLFADPHRMEELAEVGVVLVLFAVGLEFRIRRFFEILPVSGLTAAVQIGLLLWAGFTVGAFLGWSTAASLSLGAALAISSSMVVSSVLRSRPVDPDVRSHVFGILVVQDVVAIVLIAVVTALAAGQSVAFRSLGLLVGQLTAVMVGMLVVGLLILPRLVRYAVARLDTEVVVVLVASAAFGLAAVASLFGYSVALGAFLAGMVVAESRRQHEIEEAIEPLRSLFSAVFFVSIGMAVDPAVAWRNLPLAILLSGVVIVMQFASVTVGTVLTGSSLRRGVYSGLALGQIGELSFILATIATAGGVVPAETLPGLVTVATITAFTTPLLLGKAQPIVDSIDHLLPDRAQQVLAAYQSFVRKTRTPAGERSLRRPGTAVLLDWAALVLIFVLRSTLLRRVDSELAMAVDVGAIISAAPFVLGLLRSGMRLVAGVRSLTREAGGATPRARAVEALALLAVVLGIGLPTLALLRPVVGGRWLEAALLGVLLLVLVVLGMRLGNVKGEYTSGVARIALEIGEQMRGGEVTIEPDGSFAATEGPLQGIDYRPLHVRPGGPADGQTLAGLNFRCRSGATVVAIRREGEATILPTGHEQLRAGDVLAVSGSPDALERARALLEDTELVEPISA